MKEDFVLLKRIEAALSIEKQWLKKTPVGAAEFKQLGRWSRWRLHPNKWVGGNELLEAHVDLQDLAQRVGVFDVSKERYRR